MIIDKHKFQNSSQNKKDLTSNFTRNSTLEFSSTEDKIFTKTGKLIKIIV
jgi:hypothetical protein